MMHYQKNILLLYNNFNLNSDITEYIFKYIQNSSVNTIINSWYNHISYKMNLLSHILTFPTLYINNKYCYNPFDPAISLTFYKASLVLNFNDDFDIWYKYFTRLNNFPHNAPSNFFERSVYISYAFAHDALLNFKQKFDLN